VSINLNVVFQGNSGYRRPTTRTHCYILENFPSLMWATFKERQELRRMWGWIDLKESNCPRNQIQYRMDRLRRCASAAFLLSYFMVVVSSSFSEHVGPVLTNNLQSLALLKGPFEAPRMGVNTYHRIISYEHRMTCDYRG